MNRNGWWELAVVAEKLGFGEQRNLTRLVRRLMGDGLISSQESCSEGSEIRSGRGERRRLVFLAPSAVVVVAAHARTPEAAAFRREALAALAAIPANALPSAPSADFAILQRAIFDLERRVDGLTTKQDAVIERVEKIEARVPEQLQLPMAIEIDHVALHATVIAKLEKLITVVNGPNGARGLLSREIFELMSSGHVAALELREAIKAINGGRMPARAPSLGKVLLRVCDSHGALAGQWGHNHVRRWVVTSDGVH